MKTTITTTTTRNPSLIPPPNPKTLFPQRFHIIPSSLMKLPTIALSSTSRASVSLKCSKNGSPSASGNGASLKELLSGMVDERVEELLNKEENKGLLDGLDQASKRVEMAKRELAEIEEQEIMRDYVNQLESRALEIAECQKEISEAQAMVEEAERSLTDQSRDASKDEERLQSVKAASISAVIGTLAELPICLTRATSNAELILPLAITFVSCALFGVTFRYAIRRDLDNFQLKSGISAAFGFVKGVALDFCIKLRILSPFPIDPSIPKK